MPARFKLPYPDESKIVDSQLQPYNDGVSRRSRKLAPKVNAATIVTIEMMPATITERTGTAVAPSPGSNARRSPVTAAGDSPALVAAPTTRDRWLERR